MHSAENTHKRLHYFAYNAAAPGEKPAPTGTWFVASAVYPVRGPELWFGPYRTKAEAEKGAREANSK